MGTDTSDLVVTNGYRVWQRSIPLGGNHFTRQLMKEMKLTFAKAEHLKRNAREAEDPKAVFQAMRSVFGDLVTEVQRSIGYFQNIDRSAKVGEIVVLGNAAKLPGLAQYLGKNLGHEVSVVSSFNRLSGASVTNSPPFKENTLSFAVCYGLCLQGLGLGRLSTNLVPREIIVQRMIRRKKPWAVGIVGVFLLACTLHFFFTWSAWYSVNDQRNHEGTTWQQAKVQVTNLDQKSKDLKKTDEGLVKELERLDQLGEEAVATSDGRLLWLELIKALNEALPRDPNPNLAVPNEPGKLPTLAEKPLETRRELYIQYIESQYFDDLSTWFTAEVASRYNETLKAKQRKEAGIVPADSAEGGPAAGETVAAPAAAAGTAPAGNAAAADTADAAATANDQADASAEVTGPQGPGWVIEIKLRHYHNNRTTPPIAAEYVRRSSWPSWSMARSNCQARRRRSPRSSPTRNWASDFPSSPSTSPPPPSTSRSSIPARSSKPARRSVPTRFAWAPPRPRPRSIPTSTSWGTSALCSFAGSRCGPASVRKSGERNPNKQPNRWLTPISDRTRHPPWTK